MVRDYSQFLRGAHVPASGPGQAGLTALGWGPYFAQQVDADDMAQTPPVRVTAVHHSGLRVAGDGFEATLPPGVQATVGDWLMLDRGRPGASRLLERKSLIRRRAPGTDRQVQLIAANIDTVFVVTSCNRDFNPARLERYLALAFEAGTEPVIVLTKTDLVEDPQAWVDRADRISGRVEVVALDARGEEPAVALGHWCRPGRTIAFLGSSGVGKSTLTNALTGSAGIATRPVRAEDARGRHTTTRRELHAIPGGCLVLDTPGMRELQLADAEAGIAEVFGDIEALAAGCRFNDCRHDTEPGCAVQAAIGGRALARDRLARWRKLQAENAFNSASLAERRSMDRDFGRMVRDAMKAKPNRKS